MPATDLFPGWCAVAQMGHVCHRGYATVDTSLGVPMIRLELPAVEGDDDRLPLEAQVVLVAPGSLYAVTPTTEEAARRARASDRPWRPVPRERMLDAFEPIPSRPGEPRAIADAGIDVDAVRDLARATHDLAEILEGRRGRPLELDDDEDDLDDDVAPEGCRPPIGDDPDDIVAVDREAAADEIDVEPGRHDDGCGCNVCIPY